MLGHQIRPWEVLEKRGHTDKHTDIRKLLYGWCSHLGKIKTKNIKNLEKVKKYDTLKLYTVS